MTINFDSTLLFLKSFKLSRANICFFCISLLKIIFFIYSVLTWFLPLRKNAISADP